MALPSPAGQAGVRSCRCRARGLRGEPSAVRPRQVHASGDIPRIDSDRGGVASGVLVPCVKSRNQSCREGKVGAFSSCSLAPVESFGQVSLILIQREESLRGESRHEEEHRAHGRGSRSRLPVARPRCVKREQPRPRQAGAACGLRDSATAVEIDSDRREKQSSAWQRPRRRKCSQRLLSLDSRQSARG